MYPLVCLSIFGYVRKNAYVQEDINPSINIIYLTPLVYKNLTFYRSFLFLNDLEKKLLITEIDWFSFLQENLELSPIWEENILSTPIGVSLAQLACFCVTKWGHFDPRLAIFFFSQKNICLWDPVVCQIKASFSNQLWQIVQTLFTLIKSK